MLNTLFERELVSYLTNIYHLKTWNYPGSEENTFVYTGNYLMDNNTLNDDDNLSLLHNDKAVKYNGDCVWP